MTPKDPEPSIREDDIPFLAASRELPPVRAGTSSRAAAPARANPRDPLPRDPTAPPARDEKGRDAIYGQVSALLEEGRLREAENLLTRGLEIYPESVDLLKELGVLYHLQGRYGKAARTFTRVMNIAGEGQQSLSWKIAALSHKAVGELRGPSPEQSLSTFGEILAIDPTDRDARAGRIAALRILGRVEEARHFIDEGLVRDPRDPSLLYQDGWLRMDLGEADAAEDAFGRAYRADPAWPEPVLSRALALARLGRDGEAEGLLRDFAASGGDLPGLRADLGWFLVGLHRPGEAREIFLALAREEGDTGGFHGLAAVLVSLGRVTEALHIMERLAASCPRDPLVQVNRGMALARAGGGRDLAEATIAAKRALSLDPRFAPAHACLGIIAFREGRPDAAGSHLADAARFADPAGHRNLGLLACATGRAQEAEAHLRTAVRTDPHDARAWAGLGALALAGGREGEALIHLRRAAALDPHDTGVARGLALVIARTGEVAGAEEVLRKALDLARGSARAMILLELAALLVPSGGGAGNRVPDEEVRQVLREARSLSPDDPGILFYEGVAAARLGNEKEAIDRFTGSMVSDRYRIPAHENIRRIRERSRARSRIPAWVSPARSVLAVLSLLQLAAIWLFFVARLVSETGFVILTAVLSGLFALATFSPARGGGDGKEPPLDLVIPERTYRPGPEPEMASPLIRLRTALRH